jgi:hypothetical protein
LRRNLFDWAKEFFQFDCVPDPNSLSYALINRGIRPFRAFDLNWPHILFLSWPSYKTDIIYLSNDCWSELSLKTEKNDLFLHWIVVVMMLVSLMIYLFISHQFGHELQEPLPEAQRAFIRAIFYAVAIVTFPITNLIRHIQLRLNQTMPGDKSAKNRYLLTVIVSMLLVEVVGALGFVMFMLGDGFNTLYIFTGLSALGLYLYRPKQDEYIRIVEALADRLG